MKQTTKIILISFLTLTMFSCKKTTEVNDLQEAQLCLNTAAATDAKNCVAKIASLTSENAYKLRCAAVFISEGFGSPTSFISALDQIKNGGTGGYSGSIAAMGTLNFGSDSTATASANEAFDICSLSGVGVYSQISSIFKLGTNLCVLAGGATDPASLAAQASSLDSATVGAIVQTTYASACSDLTTASDSTKQYCSELSTALAAGATPTAIGACLKFKLANPNLACP